MAKKIEPIESGEKSIYDAEVVIPKYYEFERFKRKVNFKLWVVISFLFVVTLFSLTLAGIAFVRELPVVEIKDGRASIHFDTDREEITDLDLEVFIKEFINLYEGIDSASMIKNFHKALQMMTPIFYEKSLSNRDDIANRKQYQLEIDDKKLTYIPLKKRLFTEFEDWKVKIGSYDPKSKSQVYLAYATGVITLVPRFGDMELKEGEEAPRTWFLSEIEIIRVRRTERYYWGLAVNAIQTWRFSSYEEFEEHILKHSRAR